MKLLSISIAAYNVEKYLAKTLESLRESKYINDIEVLIVDDESKDDTGMIALSYVKDNPNSFKYIRKINGGHGSTINKGIEFASGKYFKLIDGDDYVDTDAFDLYIEKLKTATTDIVLNDYCIVNDSGEKRNDPAMMVKNKNILRNLECGKVYSISRKVNARIFGLHTLAIKTEILKNGHVKITENCFYVDIEYDFYCVFLSKTFQYFDDVVYMYRISDDGHNSVNKINMIKNVGMQEKVVDKLFTICEENNDEEKLEAIMPQLARTYGALIRTYFLMEGTQKAKDRIVKYENELERRHFELYKKIECDIFISLVRCLNYLFIPIIKISYLFYLKNKA